MLFFWVVCMVFFVKMCLDGKSLLKLCMFWKKGLLIFFLFRNFFLGEEFIVMFVRFCRCLSFFVMVFLIRLMFRWVVILIMCEFVVILLLSVFKMDVIFCCLCILGKENWKFIIVVVLRFGCVDLEWVLVKINCFYVGEFNIYEIKIGLMFEVFGLNCIR